MLEWLNSAAFYAFGAPTSWAEVLGFVTGAWCVYLVARANVWNWPVGIANNILWIILFFTAGLYADSFLQVVYIALGLWGLFTWLRPRPVVKVLPISHTAKAQWLALAGAGALGLLVLFAFLDNATNSTVPLADAATTVISLLAVWGQIYKKIESWFLWMLADIIYIPLYVYKGLSLTAILYAGFFALCVFGYFSWRSKLAAQVPPPVSPPVKVSS